MSKQYQTSMVIDEADRLVLLATVLGSGIRVWNNIDKQLHMGDGVTVGGNVIGAGGGGGTLVVPLFDNINTLEVGDDISFIQTSGHTFSGIGAAQYVVGPSSDPPAPETSVSTNTLDGRPVELSVAEPTFQQAGGTGNNLTTDITNVQALLDTVVPGTTVRVPQGPAGGAYKVETGSYRVNKGISLKLDHRATIRADNTAGQSDAALAINPVETDAGGFYATIQGYFSGTNLVITSNTNNKFLFGGSGLSAPGVMRGTALKLSPPSDVAPLTTGTFAVTVDNVATAQNLGNAGAPLTIKVIFNEARGMVIDGGVVAVNASGGGTGYALDIGGAADNAVFSVIGTTISNMLLGGNGAGGLRLTGGLGREHLWTTVFRSTVENAYMNKVSDGVQFRDCLITKGMVWDCIEGAFCDGVFSGFVVVKDGCDVLAGSKMKFHDIQFEQSGISALAPFRAMMMFRGFNFPGIGNEVLGNNFGGGGNYEVHLAAYNQKGLVFDRNYMFTTATPGNALGTGYDIYLDRDATNDAAAALPYLVSYGYATPYKGSQDTYDTIIGYLNRYRGDRPRQTVTEYTDVSRLLKVNRNGTIRMPHRGLWYPVADIIANKHASLTISAAGFQVIMEHSGAIRFLGGFTCAAGALTKDLDMFSLPEWLMPFREGRVIGIAGLPVGNANPDVIISMIVNPSNGYLTLRTAAPNCTSLDFTNATWMAVTDPYQSFNP